jgi:hypothetical protein
MEHVNANLSGKKYRGLGAALAVMMFGLVLPGIATAASTVSVDGIKTTGEYTGNADGTTSGKRSLLWWNDHHSIYTKTTPPATGAQMNDLFWEIHNGGSDNVSLNIFVEVPLYARRMIWAGVDKDSANACEYNGGAVSAACAQLDPGGDQAYLDAYLKGAKDNDDGTGTNHHDEVKMDYDTQTKSEYFKLNGSSVDIKWQAEDGNGLSDGFTWKTSREYLISNGICSTSLCQQFDRSSSLELMWTGLKDLAAASAIVAGITDMQLHLSDEARGLPDIPPVPVPAAFWLFGTALIGFIGMSRRTNLS